MTREEIRYDAAKTVMLGLLSNSNLKSFDMKDLMVNFLRLLTETWMTLKSEFGRRVNR